MTSATKWKTALVTGASSGIGREFALQLAARGCDVVVVARRVERLEELAEEIRGAHDVDVEIIPADLTDTDDLARVEKRLAEVAPDVDLLVNNAGTTASGRFHRLDVGTHDQLVRLNVLALTRLAHAALGRMVERGHGGIVNVSSVAGFQAIPREASYAASKAYVTHLTEALAEEVRGTGVRVTALCPGFTRTEFHPDESIEKSPLPSGIFMEPAPVVEAALKAVARGQVICVPGAGYKVTRVLSEATPRSVVRRVLGRATSQMGGRR